MLQFNILKLCVLTTLMGFVSVYSVQAAQAKCSTDNFPTLNMDNIGTLDQALFPLSVEATNDYAQIPDKFGSRYGMQKFLRAGSNLKAPKCTPVLSVAAGKVIKGPYLWTSNGPLYAVEVQLHDGSIVRYTGLDASVLKTLKTGDDILRGQGIGHVNHFGYAGIELYSGKGKGSLTTTANANKFRRRSDIMDPTQYLLDMEARTFDKSNQEEASKEATTIVE